MHLVQDIIKPRALKEKQKTIKISGTLKINEIRGQMNIFSNLKMQVFKDILSSF
jgi:hypothetical protein